ncbi:hypothetical protein C7B69_03805 [filamentous cyanobacterium Phorm 46]|nr:hypothetical protein C7B69_03805 [filamentous cyanobacterium Phorm 46]
MGHRHKRETGFLDKKSTLLGADCDKKPGFLNSVRKSYKCRVRTAHLTKLLKPLLFFLLPSSFFLLPSSFFLLRGYCQRGNGALKLMRANKCRQIKLALQTLKDNLDFTQ